MDPEEEKLREDRINSFKQVWKSNKTLKFLELVYFADTWVLEALNSIEDSETIRIIALHPCHGSKPYTTIPLSDEVFSMLCRVIRFQKTITAIHIGSGAISNDNVENTIKKEILTALCKKNIIKLYYNN
ncbi:hypothetical protein DICPUDRAFT_91817 [Dictyostelium purpureum]|uniref:Uncharacterized protein n=1 Tax=Dictyostelium purpureum TaxID=5786 RepID=F0ZHS6_DICPU|nr:uncharacterized protein DICPUDRAFT_91817 [Dictyostelium purpureum]EGC36526.1 hypothetical protein DICPUDRAFT_91817 [Dictyostelium purpureum]|eukprot:XP_003286971.1 hypothetical protein DICPUDRAFT_91817 [Dictyostelium purpureum]